MPECASTSKSLAFRQLTLALCWLGFVTTSIPAKSWAQPAGATPDNKEEKKENRANQPEEDDFSSSPFTEYGEFNEDADEAADIRFFQSGRFYGVAFGAGLQTITGNRGLLWKGGFPTTNLKLMTWFDLNFALELGFSASPFTYDIAAEGDRITVTTTQIGGAVRYSLESRNLSAPISFANPYFLVGFAAYTKSERSAVESTTESETSVGFSLGAGLEFVLKPRKAYLLLDGRMHAVNFTDSASPRFRSSLGLDDLTGTFFTWTANVLFTW